MEEGNLGMGSLAICDVGQRSKLPLGKDVNSDLICTVLYILWLETDFQLQLVFLGLSLNFRSRLCIKLDYEALVQTIKLF